MKVSTLVSVALLTAVELSNSLPFVAPDFEPVNITSSIDGLDAIEVGGAGQLHMNFLKKRSLTMGEETTKGWATGVDQGYTGTARVLRQEIRQLYNDVTPGDKGPGRVYDLYVLALRRTMIRKKEDKNSFWQLAGIHGRPFTAWNGRAPGSPLTQMKGTPPGGYCTHGSTLFPPWHRPYLAYYEEVLWASAYLEIQAEKDAKEKKQWEAALKRFRIPYWDWGLNQAQLPFMCRQQQHTFRYFPGKRNAKDFPKWENPNYSYRFQAGTADKNFPNGPWTTWRRTLRLPTSEEPGAGDNIGGVDARLRGSGDTLRQGIRELMLRNKQSWATFSNKVSASENGQSNSLESLHDIIHGWVGSGGHMSYVEYSSFDPIFFLHHTNVDRLFAMWQAINPNLWVTKQRNGGGTWGLPQGQNDTESTDLEPWIAKGGGRYKSIHVKDTSKFGYGYPEVPKWTMTNPTTLSNYVRGQVEKLYPNSFAEQQKNLQKRDDSYLNVNASSVAEGIEKSVKSNKYYEWQINICTDNYALGGTYYVHFFLGKPSRDPKQWPIQPEHVGDYVVFAHSMPAPPGQSTEGLKTKVTGSVYLTDAMVKAFGETNLTSLNPQDAIPFLERRLRWRVTDKDGNVVRVRDVKDLTVSVSIALCTLPTAEIPYTQYGDFTVLTEITRRIGRDGGPDKIGIPNLSSSSSSSSTVSTPSATPTYGSVESTTEAPGYSAQPTEAPTSVESESEIAVPTTSDAISSTEVEVTPTSTADVSSSTDE